MSKLSGVSRCTTPRLGLRMMSSLEFAYRESDIIESSSRRSDTQPGYRAVTTVTADIVGHGHTYSG